MHLFDKSNLPKYNPSVHHDYGQTGFGYIFVCPGLIGIVEHLTTITNHGRIAANNVEQKRRDFG
jgi:hypothetical protein